MTTEDDGIILDTFLHALYFLARRARSRLVALIGLTITILKLLQSVPITTNILGFPSVCYYSLLADIPGVAE